MKRIFLKFTALGVFLSLLSAAPAKSCDSLTAISPDPPTSKRAMRLAEAAQIHNALSYLRCSIVAKSSSERWHDFFFGASGYLNAAIAAKSLGDNAAASHYLDVAGELFTTITDSKKPLLGDLRSLLVQELVLLRSAQKGHWPVLDVR